MALQSSSISSSNIKLRFSEPYYSQATNIQNGVNLPGAYRGGDVLESSGGADTSFRIGLGTDGDILILHQNTTNGAATVVRLTSQVLMDMSGETWPAPSDVSWYVYLTVDYQLDAETTAAIEVDTSGSVPTDAVILGVIDVPSGATTIQQSYIRTDGSARDKVLSKKGILVKRYEEIGASAGTTRFQISDRVCWLNDDLQQSTKMQLVRDASHYELFGSDGGVIKAGDWYVGSSGGTALTVSDMDEDGCYTNPYIEMDFTDTADTDYDDAFRVLYWTHVPIDEIDTGSGDMPGTAGVSSKDVFCKAQSGTPDSLGSAPLGSQMFALLSLVNQRIPYTWPTANTSTWEILWRSNNVSIGIDSAVDSETTSIYVNSTGILVCKGGYISSTSMYMNEGGDIQCFILSDNATYSMKTNGFSSGSYPASNSLFSSSDWDYWNLSDETGDVTGTAGAFPFTFYEHASVTMNATPDDSGRDSTLEILSLDDNIRVYYRSIDDNSEFILTSGCYWSESTTTWKRVTTEFKNATALYISRGGIFIKQMDRNDALFATGWLESEWSATWTIGSETSVFTPVRLSNTISDELWAKFSVQKNDSLIRKIAKSTLTTGVSVYAVINYRDRWDTAPSSGDVTFSKFGGEDVDSIAIQEINEYAIVIGGVMDLTNAVTSYTVSSYGSGTIVISGINQGFIPYQSVAIIGTGINTYCVITDISEGGGNTTLTVESDVALPGSVTDEVVYGIPQLDQGSELVSYYRVRFNW